MLTKAKVSGNYVNSILAKIEVTRLGYDEALMLDAQGFLAEGTGENIFLVKDDILYTPSATCILPGITRSTVITLAKELGYEVKEQLLTRDDVYVADEVFFTGTAAELTPAREIDDRTIGEESRAGDQEAAAGLLRATRGRIQRTSIGSTTWIRPERGPAVRLDRPARPGTKRLPASLG
jgi:branched-subunit amino acid aminotransferase/4-amino-4-deoxychorismate lyase